MQFEGSRLILRPLTLEDCGVEYLAWLNDSQVNQYLETRHAPQTLESIKNFVASINAKSNEYLFGIFVKENNRHIGNIKLGPISDYHGTADVSLLIGAKDCWGKGYASEAISIISNAAFSHFNVKKLSAGMYAVNKGSYNAFIKAGYKDEGLRRKHANLNGVMVDVHQVGLTPEDVK